jgi:hypothetical protein
MEAATQVLQEELLQIPDRDYVIEQLKLYAPDFPMEDFDALTRNDMEYFLTNTYEAEGYPLPNFTLNDYEDILLAFKKYVKGLNELNPVGGRRKMTRKNFFWPPKYYKGLSKTKKTKRAKEIKHFTRYHWKDPRAYKGFKTNSGVRTKASSYTELWRRLFPDATSLEAKSAATGVPLGPIQESYNRGMAAWRTGHRPGATQQQWGYARVHSFLLCGKTHYSTDSDLVRKAKASSAKARRWWKVCPKA